MILILSKCSVKHVLLIKEKMSCQNIIKNKMRNSLNTVMEYMTWINLIINRNLLFLYLQIKFFLPEIFLIVKKFVGKMRVLPEKTGKLKYLLCSAPHWILYENKGKNQDYTNTWNYMCFIAYN